MPVAIPKEKWTGKIREVKFGATSESGGTRSASITLGGVSTLPFLYFEGEMPQKTVIAMEVLDVVREDYPELAREPFKDVLGSPAEWAKTCVEKYQAEAICLKLAGTNPEEEDKSPEEAGTDRKGRSFCSIGSHPCLRMSERAEGCQGHGGCIRSGQRRTGLFGPGRRGEIQINFRCIHGK